ncbi:hypothetical protein V6U81_22355 [Micromonospora sp. CPCC 205711]|uniref:hypothetical protein n=1 Tax=Micromonospora sp. CPCC 205547 TaxID=3122400 RepID=UPI002FF3D08F
MHNQPGGAPPVFVDRTGKRRRLTVIAGTVMGVGLLTSLSLILAGLFGGSAVPLPGWSDPKVAPPIEAGLDGPNEIGQPASPTPGSQPIPATSTGVPVPSTSVTGAPVTTAPSNARPTAATATTVPAPTDVRRTGKPTRSPGKPR